MDDKKCGHAACDCRARRKSEFCSTTCEAQEVSASGQCACGHADCSRPRTSAAARDADVDLGEIVDRGRKEREKL